MLNHDQILFLIVSYCFCLFDGLKNLPCSSSSFGSACTFKPESVLSIVNKSRRRIISLSFVLRCCNNFRQRQKATNIMYIVKLYTATINRQGVLRTQSINSGSDLRKRHRNFADYFCCIHLFPANSLICSQTFISQNWRYCMGLIHVFTQKTEQHLQT